MFETDVSVASQKKKPTVIYARSPEEYRALTKLTGMEQQYQSYGRPPSPEQIESARFYNVLGYPEYAGQYKPFTTPEGYKVSGITETK